MQLKLRRIAMPLAAAIAVAAAGAGTLAVAPTQAAVSASPAGRQSAVRTPEFHSVDITIHWQTCLPDPDGGCHGTATGEPLSQQGGGADTLGADLATTTLQIGDDDDSGVFWLDPDPLHPGVWFFNGGEGKYAHGVPGPVTTKGSVAPGQTMTITGQMKY